MSSDPLPLPEIWSDMPKGDMPQSARADFVANGRSGLVLIEYASGYAQPDPQPAVRPLDRAEPAGAGGHMPSFATAALAKGLSDLSAIVTQAEALLRAQGTLKGDVHFAVERIHDVALALRMRDVNAALCDTLDASVREVGDAVVRHEAAATGALSAAALLRDILNRIEDLTRVASGMIAAGAEPLAAPPGVAEVAVAVAAPARAATEATTPVPPLAPGALYTYVAVEMPALVAREAEPLIETPTPAPAASQTQAVIETPATASEAWSGPAAEQPADFAAGPQAHCAPVPEADQPDPPMAAAVDMTTADNIVSEGAVSDAMMPSGVVSQGNHAPALLNAADDALALGDDLSQEPQPIAEPSDERAVATAEPAAPQAQTETNAIHAIEVAYEIEVAEEVHAAAEMVAGEIADGQNQTAGVPPISEAAIAVPLVESGEHDPRRRASSVVVDDNAAAAETLPRRPVNDPLAAFYGLSEAELIALFT